MKKLLLLMMVGLLGVTTSQASEKIATIENGKLFSKYYRYGQPVTFVERGVTFHVYPNGVLDFNRRSSRTGYGRKGAVQVNFRSPSFQFGFNKRIGRVQYDNYGNVIKIGRTYIDYDRLGRVRQIGTVNVDYGRRGNLRQVGDMFVKYNKWGKLVYAEGNVKLEFCGVCGANSCTVNHFSNRDRRNDNWDDDDWDDDDFRKKRRKQKKRYRYDD